MTVDVDPCRSLGCAVLGQALRDAQGWKQRDEATAFIFRPDPLFNFWCDAAGVSPDLFREKARLLL